MFIDQDKSKQETERKPIIAAYLRVSTDRQTILNQKSEVVNFCKRQDIKVTLWCTETVSGTKREDERELGTLLRQLQKGDTLIITEVSRLSRRLMNIMNIIHQSIEKGITIHSIKEGYKFDSSINSQVLAFAFGLCAEIERTLISQRTREALARRRANGMKLGRPKGSVTTSKLYKHLEEIRELRLQGLSFQKIADKYNVCPETVRIFYLRYLLKTPRTQKIENTTSN
ncbi:MAG: recombinase family protein [Odoribacter sp.]|nr:recombinase family protein [Odoribacter sp.]